MPPPLLSSNLNSNCARISHVIKDALDILLILLGVRCSLVICALLYGFSHADALFPIDFFSIPTTSLVCYVIYNINNLETEPPLRHFIDQTTEATISKFGSGVLYSIRMKMGIIKSVLIKGFILKKNEKNFFSLSALYFKDLFRLDTSHTGSIN